METDYPAESYEIVLIDDGSSDDWREKVSDLLDSHPRNLKIVTEHDRGPAASRNTGIKVSKGPIVAITDADCVVSKSWLRNHARHYRDPKVGGVEGRVETDWGRLLRPRRTAPAGFRYVTANMSYRREALEDAGLFDERFRWKEDDELAYRVMKRGWSIVSDSEAAVYHPVETLSLNELFKRGLKHQYDVLFYKKHPDIAVAYFRLLKLGPVAITPIFLFIIGVLCTLAALMEVAFNEVNISIPLVSCSAFLFAYVYLKSRHKELKISFFWMAIFAIFMEIGRILGCLRFRKILL